MENATITGGAGFIGCNLAHRLLEQGWRATIYDNMSSAGSDLNVGWLQALHGSALTVVPGDIRDFAAVLKAVQGADVVYHLAGKASILRSIADPRLDFEVNALGTLNVLEAARQSLNPPIVVTASSSQVYGALRHVPITELGTRYAFRDLPNGITEDQPVDPCTPYGCSKAVADQYTRGYARMYGMRTVVFRLSVIYGPHQLGVEDQGWVAYFALQAALRRPIVRYGTGKQVRDILFVDDLVEALTRVPTAIERISGKTYNVGGGSGNALSVWQDFEPLLAKYFGMRPDVARVEDERPLDTKVYVSDITRVSQDLGWAPTVEPSDGVTRLLGWIEDNFASLRAIAF